MMPDDLVLESSPLEGFPNAAVVRISGKGGSAAVRRLQEAVQPLLDQGTANLLFDCDQVQFFNSMALGYLINLADTARKAGGTIAFCRMPKRVGLAFDLLGLRDFFEFHPDPSGFIQHLRSVAPAPAAPEESAPARTEGSLSDEPLFSIDRIVALPSWLDEDERPAAPPIDHLRWAALLQAVVRRFGMGSLAEVCRRSGVPSEGPSSLVIRGILKNFRSPEDLLGYFDESLLAQVCGLFGISVIGGKESRIKAVVAFIQQSTTETLAGVAAGATDVPAGPLELTPDAVLGTLQSCTLPKRLKSERSARDLFFKKLAKVFGKDKIARDRPVGRHFKTKVALDIAGRFGILVRMAKSVVGKTSSDAQNVLGLLGQVSLLAGNYGSGHLFIVILGEIPEKDTSALGELKGWMEGVGARFVHLRNPGMAVKKRRARR